jgi:uncharacterized membrane protein (DUF4010 family)
LLLAALALVLLPLMPAAPQPWLPGLSPRHWVGLVVLMLLLQAGGHVGMRLLGPALGLGLAGFFGGFISSTATIASMGARSRAHPAQARACEGAAVMSTSASWVFAVILLAAVSPQAAAQLMPVAVAGAVVSAFAGLWLSWSSEREASAMRSRVIAAAPKQGPLRIREALLVAALLGAVSLGVSWAQARFGSAGVLASSALAALADAQSSIAALGALHQAGRLSAETVVTAIVLALAANGLTRSIAAAASGGARFAWTVGLSLLASTGAAALVAAANR